VEEYHSHGVRDRVSAAAQHGTPQQTLSKGVSGYDYFIFRTSAYGSK
jgi:hypothetical protein